LIWRCLALRKPGWKAAVEAIRNGELDEAIVDESARCILKVIFQAQQTPKGKAFDQEAHHQLAKRIASKGLFC